MPFSFRSVKTILTVQFVPHYGSRLSSDASLYFVFSIKASLDLCVPITDTMKNILIEDERQSVNMYRIQVEMKRNAAMAHVKPCSVQLCSCYFFVGIHGRAHACSSPACCLISSSLFSTACHAVNICIHVDFILLLFMLSSCCCCCSCCVDVVAPVVSFLYLYCVFC